MTDSQTLGGGRYVLVKRLGEGGMATVWRAFDQRLQVWRAVKVLLPEYSVKPKILARFNAEAQTMALLEHPHIVRVYDVEIPMEGVGENGDPPFIVMELVEGGSLVDWLEQFGPMPARLAVQVVVAACQALEAAHARSVIHRDVKPHNIMIDREGVVRLTDFGIARAADGDGKPNLTRTGAVMGTLGYMAPEQKSDAKHLDGRADIYAMAATLYSLLTDQTPMDLFASEKDATILEGVPDPLVPVLVKATEYRPDARYSTALEFAAALLKAAEALPPDPVGSPPLLRPLDAPPLPPVSSPETTRYGTRATTSKSQPGHTGARSNPAGVAGNPGGATLLPDDAERSGGFMTMPPLEHDNLAPASQDRAVWTPQRPAAAPSRSPVILGVLLALLASGAAAFVFWPKPPPVVALPAPTVEPEVPAVDPTAVAPVVPPVPDTPVAPAPVVAPVAAPVTAPAHTPAPAVTAPVTTGKPPRVEEHLHEEPPPPVEPPPPPVEERQCFLSVKAPPSAAVGGNMPFSAKTCKDGNVVLFYRAVGGGEWFRKSLRLVVGAYQSTVPMDASFESGVEWYMEADGVSYGSVASPKVVKVAP